MPVHAVGAGTGPRTLDAGLSEAEDSCGGAVSLQACRPVAVNADRSAAPHHARRAAADEAVVRGLRAVAGRDVVIRDDRRVRL